MIKLCIFNYLKEMDIMIKGIAHTAYNVLNMEDSLYFYCDVLGFKKAFDLNDEEGNPWIVYLKIKEGQFIELFYGDSKKVKENLEPSSYSHLCLEVDDIYEIAERLEKMNVKLDVKPNRGKDLNYQCWTKDPDGNRIEFMQMDPNSPQNKN
jgi:catechol 2,3-dioxygenase-like lactoylglutathione lyase family enzyme